MLSLSLISLTSKVDTSDILHLVAVTPTDAKMMSDGSCFPERTVSQTGTFQEMLHSKNLTSQWQSLQVPMVSEHQEQLKHLEPMV